MTANREYAVIVRVVVDDDTLVHFGKVRGDGLKWTVREFRNWAHSVLEADIEEIVSTTPWQEANEEPREPRA